jgi:hypothetical protein
MNFITKFFNLKGRPKLKEPKPPGGTCLHPYCVCTIGECSLVVLWPFLHFRFIPGLRNDDGDRHVSSDFVMAWHIIGVWNELHARNHATLAVVELLTKLWMERSDRLSMVQYPELYIDLLTTALYARIPVPNLTTFTNLHFFRINP